MVATELSSRVVGRAGLAPGRSLLARQARSIVLAYGLLWSITLLGALIGSQYAALAPSGAPHPTLRGTVGELGGIAATNVRVLSAPFLLAFFRMPADRRTRVLGDVLVAVLLAGNALRVGLALGHFGDRLIPYVPQLPLEWLAAALAAGAWLNLRSGVHRWTVLRYLPAILAVVVAAAAIEAFATPHVLARKARTEVSVGITALPSAAHLLERKAGGGLPALRSCAGAGSRFKVASLPSPRCRSVPLGRLAGASGLRQPPPDPAKEGPQ